MPFPCHGIYTSKCARNEIWKWCHSCHTGMCSVYLFHGVFCGRRGSYGPCHGNMKRPVPPFFNDWSESYLLSRMEWWSVTLTLPQALHLWLWEMTVELMWCRVEGRRKSSAQTRSQISLHLLSNQVIFDHMQVNISVIKLWCVTGTFSFLTPTAELVVPWPGMRSQTGHV